jgi:hypothetical protein
MASSLQQQREQYCNTPGRPASLLHAPVEATETYTYIPIVQLKSVKAFQPWHLNDPRVNWKQDWVPITTISSNYTSQDYKDLYVNACQQMEMHWFTQQAFYLQSLGKEQAFTLLGYSHLGDEVVNKWCLQDDTWWTKSMKVLLMKERTYDNEFFPLFYAWLNIGKNYTFKQPHIKSFVEKYIQVPLKTSEIYSNLMKIKHKLYTTDFQPMWKQVVTQYAQMLEEMIKQAPKLNRCMTVWRGTNTPYWISSSSTSSQVHFDNFVSASIDLTATASFRHEDDTCCLLRITIPAGSACLFMAGLSQHTAEAEVLLARNATFHVDVKSMSARAGESSFLQPYKLPMTTPHMPHILCAFQDQTPVMTSMLVFDRYS